MGFHINIIKRVTPCALLLLALILLPSCAHFHPVAVTEPALAYMVRDGGGPFAAHSPVFLIEDSNKSYNLIGTPTAELDSEGKEKVYVNSDLPAVYTLKHDFKTARNSYTNLYYRIHFEKSAFRLVPFNVSAGRNTGLIIVVTLNQRREPILYTIVHTCGCYLAFIPTSFMPREAYPPGWNTEGQRIYGEKLTGLLTYPEDKAAGYRAVLTLRSGTHRVKGVSLLSTTEINKRYRIVTAPALSLNSLETLPIKDGGSTSFFETEGPRKDYVKGSHKPWEKVFISWWALKWRVGEDKIFRPDRPTETVFFTSLKFWDRSESDMEDFVEFLRYWQWGL